MSLTLQDSTITVLRNDYGAVHETTRGFTLTPPRVGLGAAAPSFTPSKVMLTAGESQMNMLTSDARDKVHQVRCQTPDLPFTSCSCTCCCCFACSLVCRTVT